MRKVATYQKGEEQLDQVAIVEPRIVCLLACLYVEQCCKDIAPNSKHILKAINKCLLHKFEVAQARYFALVQRHVLVHFRQFDALFAHDTTQAFEELLGLLEGAFFGRKGLEDHNQVVQPVGEFILGLLKCGVIGIVTLLTLNRFRERFQRWNLLADLLIEKLGETLPHFTYITIFYWEILLGSKLELP